MEATLAYQAGKPIVSDEEYDNLRRELRNKNSKVVQQVQLHIGLPCEISGLQLSNLAGVSAEA